MGERAFEVGSAVKDRAMDEAPVGIVLSDPHTEDNPLIYVNDTFVELTGYTRDEILGRNCRFLQGPETDDNAVELMREAIDSREPVTVEVRNYRSDGEAFWNEVTIAPVHNDAGELTHFVGFQSDVTERKEAQLALQQRTTELEHLIDRLDGLLQDITEELMHATSRDESERAICERLVATEPYQFAWVGVRDPVDGSIEATSWAGEVTDTVSEPLTDAVTTVSAEALESGAVVTVDDRNRLTALAAPGGIDSVAVIPLRYRTQQYGVIVVGTAAPDTLKPPETAVLGSLGRTIATAIHAAQTQRQLAEDSRVVAEFSITDPALTAIALARHRDMELSFEGAIDQRDGSVSMFYTVDASLDELKQAAASIDDIESIIELRSFEETRLIEVREVPPAVVTWLAELGASIAELTVDPSKARLELEMSPSVDGRAVVERIKERFTGTELVAYRTEDRPPQTRVEFTEHLDERLTDQQRLVLKRAYLSGFYDRNRKITGSELAESMDLSRSTFHQHRRVAERKLIEAYFEG